MEVPVSAEMAKKLNDLAASSGRASVVESFRATLDLFQTGVDVMRQNLRRRYPEAGEEEIDRFLRGWLLERPGAESGDSPGRAVDVNTRLV